MSLKIEFTQQNKTVELSQTDLQNLQQAVTYALNGGERIAMRSFGKIRVLGSGIHQAFNSQQPNNTIVQTDC